MSYQTVLVPLDAGPRCAARVALAARLVPAAGGHLVGLAPTGLPDVLVTTVTRACANGCSVARPGSCSRR